MPLLSVFMISQRLTKVPIPFSSVEEAPFCRRLLCQTLSINHLIHIILLTTCVLYYDF